MAFTMTPFLFQTRTLLKVWKPRAPPIRASQIRPFASRRTKDRSGEAVPFDYDSLRGYDKGGQEESTITPGEAEIFRNIFDEIAQGQMPPVRKDRASTATSTIPSGGSISDSSSRLATQNRDRIQAFREKFLQRYPQSLRESAQLALGFHESRNVGANAEKEFFELDEADRQKMAADKARYEKLREEQRVRVEALMDRCSSDAELWTVVEKEVFTLPGRFGLAGEGQKAPRRKRMAKTSEHGVEDAALSTACQQAMNVHGPLYPHYLTRALTLFDSFARPSPYAFRILPAIKAMGLPSYILGVSTTLLTRLARIHWLRYGDAASALDTLREMSSMGLYADEEVVELLQLIQEHVHACTWGAQGPFAMAVMETSPEQGPRLPERLDEMLQWAVSSSTTRAREQAPYEA